MKRLALLLATSSAVIVACGGSQPAPPPPASGGETDAAVSPPSAVETPDAGQPVTAAASDAGTGGGSGPDPKAASSEPEDSCAPVAVDFEKRARPKLKDCYRDGKKKDPNLVGNVRIKITVDLKGKIKSTKAIEKTLPDPVVECMVKVVKATPFPEVEKCWDRTITIPMTFPTTK